MAISAYVGASVYSGYKQRSNAKKSAKEMRKLGLANEKNIISEGAEDYRRSSRSFDQIIGKSKAIAGAGGIGGVSKQNYLKELDAESSRQLDWINTSTASRGLLARKQGYAAAKRVQRAGDAALLNGIVSAFGIYAASGSNFGLGTSAPYGNVPGGTGTGSSRYKL